MYPVGVEFHIGLIETLACVHCQLKLKFLAPRGEQFH